MDRFRILAALPLIAVLSLKDRLVGPDTRWRRWLAWHPVEVCGQRVWLRWVQRRIGIDDDEPPIMYRARRR